MEEASGVGGRLLPRRLGEAGVEEDQQGDEDEPNPTDGGVDEGRRGRPGSSAAEEPFMAGGYESARTEVGSRCVNVGCRTMSDSAQ